MKFGENLSSLSIPEWKSYNLDYNDLKSKIRQLTRRRLGLSSDDHDSDASARHVRHGDVTLRLLYHAFVDNFNYVDLFIVTKRGELERKLVYNQKVFARILLPKLALSLVDHQILLNELYYQVLEISRTLRNLNGFIIIQKIACNKIFKKFIKYYPNEQVAVNFVGKLKTYLSASAESFINRDLTSLTLELSYFLDCITDELKRLEHNQRVLGGAGGASGISGDSRRRSHNSLFLQKSAVSTNPNSITWSSNVNAAALCNGGCTNTLHPQQDPPARTSRFDLDISIRKNFKIDCLIADHHNLNDLLLNMRVLLNCENVTDITRTSSSSLSAMLHAAPTAGHSSTLLAYTFLTADLAPGLPSRPTLGLNQSSAPPAYIILQFGQPTSLIISFVGGLRRYAYCFLPNDTVQLLLNHLNHPHDADCALQFAKLFDKDTASPLTKMALDWILNKGLKPTLKCLLQRSHYIVRRFSDEDATSRSDGEAPAHSIGDEATGSDIPARLFEDDFLMCIDQDIYTTNHAVNIASIDFDPRLGSFDSDVNCLATLAHDETFDRFPIHRLSIFSNDSSLSNFRRQMNVNYLTNKVLTEPIVSSPNQRYLKRMPIKIQQLLNLSSINLFNGDLNLYCYMLSCYYNQLPPQEFIYSHFMNLLTLNLLKQNESILASSQVAKFHDRLYEQKTRQVLRTQSSLRSIKLVSEGSTRITDPPAQSYPPALLLQLVQPRAVYEALEGLPLKDDEILLVNNSYKNYGAIPHMDEFNLTVFDRFVNFAARLKAKLTGKGAFETDLGIFVDDQGGYVDDDEALSHSDSSAFQLEMFKDQYMRNYDEMLSIIYFSFFFISLFISGIIMGIVYSLFELSTDNTQFLLDEDNVYLILIIIMGLLLSLMFSMVSINLKNSRYQKGPTWHSCIIWIGSATVALSLIWTLLLLCRLGEEGNS